MKPHTTNYENTFIAVAEDCPVSIGTIPPLKSEVTIASMQLDMISEHPYQYTSDDVIFHGYAMKQGLRKAELPAARAEFFSKGQPCLRSSPLTKRYGFGIHSDAKGKVALYAMETEEYKGFESDPALKVVKAMRSKKAG